MKNILRFVLFVIILVSSNIQSFGQAPQANSPQLFCSAEEATIADLVVVITISGAYLTWYDDATLSTVLPETTLLIDGISYFVTQTDASGNESPATEIVVMITETPEDPNGATLQEFCEGDNAILADLNITSDDAGFTLLYYETLGDYFAGNDIPDTTLLSDIAGGLIVVSQVSLQGCESVDLLTVTFVLNPNPDAPEGATEQIFCVSDNATVSDLVAVPTPPNSLITWYDGVGTILNFTDTLEDGVMYYATQTSLAAPYCESIEQLAVMVIFDFDCDDDSVLDEDEVIGDTDGDGIDDYMDPDDDGDSVATIIEAIVAKKSIASYIDTDGDGTPNYLDNDDDGDGVLTLDEDYNGDGDPTNDDVNSNGVPDYLDPEVTSSVGEENLSLFKIYPNPVSDIIQIELKENIAQFSLVISNIQSQKVFIKEIQVQTNILSLDMSDFNAGVYFINVKADVGSQIQKIIVK